MTIKEKFDIRLSRLKEYMHYVSLCRDARRILDQAEENITDRVDADKVDDVFACIKSYTTSAPATNTYDIGENVYQHIAYCHRFDQKPCPIFNCPFYENKKLYDNQKLLFKQAKIDKHLAFKRMFERIK